MFGGLASLFGFGGGSHAGTSPGVNIRPIGAQELAHHFGPPPGDPTQDKIVSDIYSPPYRSPGEFNRDSGETAQMRREYRRIYYDNPIVTAAVRGKANDICVLPPTVLPADKDDPVSCLAAEFVEWAVTHTPQGWPGLIDAIYTPGSIDGWSASEKRLEVRQWKGRTVWGLAHVRGIDTTHLRLKLDVARNVQAVVNTIRGLEYFNPDDVILYSHNSLFSDPFGHSDLRAVVRAAKILEDTYRVWYIALKVYGLPYMHGMASQKTGQKAMGQALQSLREGGYIVTDKDDEVKVLNLASAAAATGFTEMIRANREDVFYAIRGAALPFLEGDGKSGSHGDTGVEQQTSDAGEVMAAHRVASVINYQLIPWLVKPNFGDIAMPTLRLGGTSVDAQKKRVELIKGAQEAGLAASAEWAHKFVDIPPPRDENDKLVSAQEKQQQAQQQQQGAMGMSRQPGAAPQAAPAPQEQPAAFSADAVVWLPTDRLAADPSRFQYRRGHDADDGTVRDLPTDKFDPRKCPPLAAWHDPESGETFVVDGHHRLAWAERDGVKRVPVRFVQAKTAAEAKRIGVDLNKQSKTFSADHGAAKPANEPDTAQVSRVIDSLLKELAV